MAFYSTFRLFIIPYYEITLKNCIITFNGISINSKNINKIVNLKFNMISMISNYRHTYLNLRKKSNYYRLSTHILLTLLSTFITAV